MVRVGQSRSPRRGWPGTCSGFRVRHLGVHGRRRVDGPAACRPVEREALVQAGDPSTGSDVSWLAAVSCPGRNLCVAVGHFISGYYTPSTLVERWNGKRWQIDWSPNAGSADGSISGTGELTGVSCPSARVCVGVGTSGAGAYPPVFARWKGHRWSKMAQPAGPLPFGSLTVSCSAVNACTAIGTVWEPSYAVATYPVIERWNGTRWSLQHTPRSAPSSTVDGYFGCRVRRRVRVWLSAAWSPAGQGGISSTGGTGRAGGLSTAPLSRNSAAMRWGEWTACRRGAVSRSAPVTARTRARPAGTRSCSGRAPATPGGRARPN
jgi:hypothetical protein